MKTRTVFRFLSFSFFFVGILMLIPLLMAVITGEREAQKAFIFSVLIIAALGALIYLLTKNGEGVSIGAKESILIVTATWIVMTALGALPLYFSHTFSTYTACFYEIMSGFTTTGATALENIDSVAHPILLWRSMTNWIGGIGVIVIFVVFLPLFGGGASLVGAESTGPTKQKIAPTIRRSALILFCIYLFFSFSEVILLLIGKLPLFDAVTVMCGTMANAGYIARDGSVGAYASPYVEWVCIIFMFVAGVNFSLYYFPLQKKPGKLFKNAEFKAYLFIALLFSSVSSVFLFISGKYNLHGSIRSSLFHVISLLSTTGFTTADYNLWPSTALILLFITCFIGGCAGSAAGGIKVSRILIILKTGKNSIKERIHPGAVSAIGKGDNQVDDKTALKVGGFVGMYFLTILIGTLALSFTGENLITLFSASVQAVGNIGVGFGGIGTTLSFSIFPPWAMWVLSFLMLAGRLELFTVYALLLPSFWKK